MSIGEADNMLRFGYGVIADRYIEPVRIEDVAIEGLRGLSDLDPSLAVGKIGNAVDLSVRGKVVASEPTPKSRDVEGWAKLSVRIWRAARAVSPRIAAMPQEDVYEAIFDRLTATLDSNSRYATAAEARRNRQRRDGYQGIGARIGRQRGEPAIIEVIGNGPAERAGLRVGDVITQIDGRPVSGLSVEEINALLQEDVVGWVRLTVRRQGRGMQRFVVLRSYLIPDTVRKHYADGILYLTVSHFNQGTADNIARTLAEFPSDSKDRLLGVVLDLRGNPGGLLQQAVKVSDLFLVRGPILSTRGRHPDSVQDYVAGGDDVTQGLPLVILIDGETASAAEITAAALQDRGRAVIVGSTSYGKGTVQTVVPLPNGGELSFTWSHAVFPSGIDLRGNGVHPSLCTSGLYVAEHDSIDQLFARGTPLRAEMDGLGCPAERRDSEVDLQVARRLLENPQLYADALGTGAIVAQVPKGVVP